jgi:hypothetical protein
MKGMPFGTNRHLFAIERWIAAPFSAKCNSFFDGVILYFRDVIGLSD